MLKGRAERDWVSGDGRGNLAVELTRVRQNSPPFVFLAESMQNYVDNVAEGVVVDKFLDGRGVTDDARHLYVQTAEDNANVFLVVFDEGQNFAAFLQGA